MPPEKPVILCVDDEQIPLTLRKSVLEKLGYSVLTANSGTEALEQLQRQHVDLVLTDMLMPGLSGAELAREIKQRLPQLPIILFSGVNEMPEDASYADVFLSKVEGPARMSATISEVLSQARKLA
ncbi:MAG: response regulator [Candidatus Korobacteraceae bacterium]